MHRYTHVHIHTCTDAYIRTYYTSTQGTKCVQFCQVCLQTWVQPGAAIAYASDFNTNTDLQIHLQTQGHACIYSCMLRGSRDTNSLSITGLLPLDAWQRGDLGVLRLRGIRHSVVAVHQHSQVLSKCQHPGGQLEARDQLPKPALRKIRLQHFRPFKEKTRPRAVAPQFCCSMPTRGKKRYPWMLAPSGPHPSWPSSRGHGRRPADLKTPKGFNPSLTQPKPQLRRGEEETHPGLRLQKVLSKGIKDKGKREVCEGGGNPLRPGIPPTPGTPCCCGALATRPWPGKSGSAYLVICALPPMAETCIQEHCNFLLRPPVCVCFLIHACASMTVRSSSSLRASTSSHG